MCGCPRVALDASNARPLTPVDATMSKACIPGATREPRLLPGTTISHQPYGFPHLCAVPSCHEACQSRSKEPCRSPQFRAEHQNPPLLSFALAAPQLSLPAAASLELLLPLLLLILPLPLHPGLPPMQPGKLRERRLDPRACSPKSQGPLETHWDRCRSHERRRLHYWCMQRVLYARLDRSSLPLWLLLLLLLLRLQTPAGRWMLRGHIGRRQAGELRSRKAGTTVTVL